jgi:hypothetical protein
MAGFSSRGWCRSGAEEDAVEGGDFAVVDFAAVQAEFAVDALAD